MIGLVTDSGSQIPPDLARQLAVKVVPLTVRVDGTSYLEGRDLDADGFWALFDEAAPEVATSQPSPGQFAQAYERVAADGADEILSVHIGSGLSGTVNAARLASASAPVPVRVVDTGTVSFAVTCCVWEAALAVAAGASLDEVATVAEMVAGTVRMVFVVKALDLARAGGRLATPGSGELTTLAADGVPLLTFTNGAMEVIGQAVDIDDAADAMADHVRAAGSGLRVGVGCADPATEPLARALEDRLVAADQVIDLVRYRVGPSVGAHTGPGTVGAVWYPADPARTVNLRAPR